MSDTDQALEDKLPYLVPINKLPPEHQARVVEAADLLDLKKKQVLFNQGERDDFTFYVIEGDIEMYADDSLIKRVAGNDAAAFQPLAQLQPRQMTAIAKTRAKVMRVKRSLLDQLLSMEEPAAEEATGMEVEEVEAASGDWLMTLLQSDLFTRIPPSHIQNLLDTLETVAFKEGDMVVRQGEPGDFYYIVQSGRCEVIRSGAKNREIKLAELKSGDTFGEEALISNAKRNASVRMVQAGELARMTKDDFSELIKAPLLNAVSLETARERVASGASWLDVRFEDEHAHNGLDGSLNVPLSTLRTKVDDLDAATAYVAYCDTGGRSSAAAFLLAERGFEVCYVEDGAVSELAPTPAATPDLAAIDDVDLSSTIGSTAKQEVLRAEFEKAQLTIARAEEMMARAQAMKEESERIVAEKLASERSRLDAEDDAARKQLDEENAALRKRLAEAEALKEKLSEQQSAAAAEAARREEAADQRIAQAEARAEARLREEEARLEEMYREHAEKLDNLQADREEDLREELRKQLDAERRKFETEVMRTNEELERAREERRRALEARDAAAEEARQAIETFRAEQEKLLADQAAAFAEERARLTEDAARLKAAHEQATRAREEAESAKRAIEQELVAARERDKASAAATPSAETDRIQQRASEVELELQQAVEAESAAAAAARDNEDELERTYDTANEINMLLKSELDDWITEQDKLQDSTLQRKILSRQKEMVERIKARARDAQRQEKDRNQSLIDEIADQLGDG